MGQLKVEIAKNLRYFRRKRNLTQKDLADKLGVKHNAVSSWENGKNSVDIEYLYAICEVLDITISDICGSSGQDENKRNISLSEYEHIKKYRQLDSRGRGIVDSILDFEYLNAVKSYSNKRARINDNEEKIRELPVYVASAAAGIPLPIPTEDYEVWEVDSQVPAEASFGIKLYGNSMEPRYPNGEVVWVKQQPDLEHGQIGIFILNAEALCKKLEYREDIPYLISLNKAFSPIKIGENDDLRVVGRVL